MEAFPGLTVDEDGRTLSVRLFHSAEEALVATRPAFQRLCELQAGRDLAWFDKDLRHELQRVGPDAATLGDPKALAADASAMLRRALFRPDNPLPLRKSLFDKTLQDGLREMRGLPQRFTDLLAGVFDLRREIVLHKAPYPGMPAELDALMPPDFLRITPLAHLRAFPRYLRAMLRRADQHRISQPKHAQKLDRIRPYAQALHTFAKLPRPTREQRALTEQLHWMIEEFKVQVFAQDLGTGQPVSEKRLDALIERIRG
jgi:ATP-dependent helicase HrpA